MRVELQYFRSSGKWYSEGSYESNKAGLWEIWAEVRTMQERCQLPGLISGADYPFILVDVPEHPHRHPHLIIDPHIEEPGR